MFQSVEDFLRKAMGAKSTDRQIIDQEVGPLLDDPDMIGVPVELLNSIEKHLQTYGDEALRQIALFCCGKWLTIHQEFLEQHLLTETADAAALTAADMSTLSNSIKLLASVGSFGGDEEWRTMLKEYTVQAVLEQCEEDKIDISSFFNK